MSNKALVIKRFANVSEFAQEHHSLVQKYFSQDLVVDCIVFLQGSSTNTINLTDYVDHDKKDIVIIVAPQAKIILYDPYRLHNNILRSVHVIALHNSECDLFHRDISDVQVHGELMLHYQAFDDADVDVYLYDCSAKVLHQNIVLDLFESSNIAVFGGAYVGSDQYYQITSQQNHHNPQTMSNIVVKRVAKDASRVSYKGHVFVAPGADGALVDQKDQTLIAGDNVQIFSQPALEALHNNISCFHGSSMGGFSQEELFFLTSRGIKLSVAKQMIEQGFFSGLFNHSPFAKLIQSFFTKTVIIK